MGYLSTYSQSSWYLAYNILIYVLTAALFSPIVSHIRYSRMIRSNISMFLS